MMYGKQLVLLHPREWRRYMRDEAERRRWTKRRMRRELRKCGNDALDPWKVPLPVVQPGTETLFGVVLFGVP